MAVYGVFRADGSLAYIAGGHRPAPDSETGYVALLLDSYDPAANTYTMVNGAVAATPIDALITAKAAKTSAALSHQSGLVNAGFTYGGTLYQIDAASQTRIAAMGALALGSITDPTGSPWQDGFYWVAADNSHVPMDAAATYEFARAAALYVSGCVLRLRAIKDAIAGAADEAALDTVDVTSGYPSATA